MTTKEAIEQAKKNLKRLLPAMSGDCCGWIKDLVAETLALFESAKAEQPPEGEFTKRLKKDSARYSQDAQYTVREACCRLDAQQQEIDCFKLRSLSAEAGWKNAQQEIDEMTESAGFWGRSCARLRKKIDAQQQELEELKTELSGARQGAFGFIIRATETIQQGMARNYNEFHEETVRLNSIIVRLTAGNKALTERIERLIKSLRYIATYKEQPVFYDTDRLSGIAVTTLEADKLREREKAQALQPKEGKNQ